MSPHDDTSPSQTSIEIEAGYGVSFQCACALLFFFRLERVASNNSLLFSGFSNADTARFYAIDPNDPNARTNT